MKRHRRAVSKVQKRSKQAGTEGKTKSPRAGGRRSHGSAASGEPEAIRQRNEKLQLVSDCLAQLLSERKTEKLVSDIFPRVAAHVGADAFFNYLSPLNACTLDLLAAESISADVVCDICEACSGGALQCLAAKRRNIVSVNDIQRSTDPKLGRVRESGIQTYLCIPLLIRDRLLGVLSVASRSKTSFSKSEIDFLRLISGYVAVATDRARSEELLREREQRLQIALKSAEMGTWELEVRDGLKDSHSDAELVRIADRARPSPEVEIMMGLRPGEYRSHHDWESHIHPDDREPSLQALRAAMRGDLPSEVVHRYIWDDGTVHWICSHCTLFHDADGVPRRVMGVAVDITDRKRAETEIRERNERLQFVSGCLAQLLAERNPDQIVTSLFSAIADQVGADACFNFHVDGDKPEIVLHVSLGISEEVKRRLLRLHFGEGPCGVVAKRRSIFVANDIQNSTDPDTELVRELGFKSYVGFPLMVGERLLGTLDFEAKSKPAFSEQERDFLQLIANYVAIAIDRAESERNVIQSKEAAEKASRAKDLFIAALSHELRNPLTPALMTASSLEQDESLDTPIREQMCVVRRSVELEARLIDDLLDLTRIERGKFTLRIDNVDVQELLARALEIVREDLLLKHLKVMTENAAGPTVVQGDPARLQQVFWNLLNNAIKFTPANGSIRVCIFNPKPETLAIEFQDTGIGIAPESLGRIFNPFEQCATAGDHRYGGLGLGLAICKAIIELQGGTIAVSSAGLNQGATFTIALPLPLTGGAETTAEGESIVSSKRRSDIHHHILLVEDHEQTRIVLARMLARDGHDVQTAGTCDAALEAAHAPSGHRFDVLISDIGLPDGSGLGLVRKLKAEIPELTAIALSGYGTNEDVTRSMEAGFNIHLIKPIALDELRRALAA